MGRGTVMAFVALGLSVVILANDFSALNVSLPSIEEDFDTDVSTVQWVINAYALVFGVLIVTGGRLADILGRKRIFMIGATIFAVMSVIGGLAPNEYILIAARAVMGVGGAMMWPAILGMTYAAVPEEKAGMAGGLILGSAGVGQAIGPLTGGILTEFISWRGVLIVNLPIALFAMAVVWRKIHQPQGRAEGERPRLRRHGDLVRRAVRAAVRARPGDRLGLERPAHHRRLRRLRRARRLRPDRAPHGPERAAPGDLVPNGGFIAAWVPRPGLGALLRRDALPAAVHAEGARLLAHEAGLGMLPLFAAFAVVSFAAGPLYSRLGAKLIVSLGLLG